MRICGLVWNFSIWTSVVAILSATWHYQNLSLFSPLSCIISLIRYCFIDSFVFILYFSVTLPHLVWAESHSLLNQINLFLLACISSAEFCWRKIAQLCGLLPVGLQCLLFFGPVFSDVLCQTYSVFRLLANTFSPLTLSLWPHFLFEKQNK